MVNLNGKSVIVRMPTEPQLEPTNEASPLNQRGRDTYSDASSSAVTSEGSTKKLCNKEMDQSRSILLGIAIDSLLLCCAGVPIMILFFFGSPYERGFFCNDETLMHPFKKSTVRHSLLFTIGFGLPMTLIIIIELVRGKLKLDDDRPLKLFGWNIPATLQNLYKFIGFFAFGAACCQLTTEIAKYSVGRFRPHFISVCQPVMTDGTDCTNAINLRRYVENFTCSNPNVSNKLIKDMRMSFPSANSSFSFYAMVFCALYLHSRMSWKGSNLFKYFLQFILLMMAWITSLSRISDYKHHWSDVLSGAALGIFFAAITRFWISKASHKRSDREQLSTVKTELNSTNGNNS